jgi:hypothetical protein
MSRHTVAAAFAVLGLFPVSAAFADPTAQWGGPWMVVPGSFSLTSVPGDKQIRRAFGEDARRDGEILNVGPSFEPLPGTPARAKVYAAASTSSCVIICNHVFAVHSIDFERTFEVAGSPSGDWDITLTGSLLGSLHIDIEIGAFGDVGAPNPIAQVEAVATISAAADPGTPLIIFKKSSQITQRIESDSFASTGILKNGLYVVRGTLELFTDIDEAFDASAFLEADFFDDEAGLRVNVAATPRVTEESIIITAVYQTLLHRLPTADEMGSALAYLSTGGTAQGLRGRLIARFISAL